MTETATLARPYAEAVFKTAKESAALVQWSQTLKFLSAVVQDPEIASAMGNPAVDRQKFTELLLDICAQQIDDQGANFIKLLVHNGRLALLPHIAALYEQYKAEDEGYVDVDVWSAFALNKQEVQKLSAALTKRLNKKVNVNVAIDKSLIGGILVRAGDQVIDGSIKGRLQQLAKQL